MYHIISHILNIITTAAILEARNMVMYTYITEMCAENTVNAIRSVFRVSQLAPHLSPLPSYSLFTHISTNGRSNARETPD